MRLTAYHEGGHALVTVYTKGARELHKATIVPRGNALGMVSSLSENEMSLSKTQSLAQMAVAMGGRAAEELIFGEESVTTGASSDFQQATNIARRMVTQWGMSEKIGKIFINEEELAHMSSEKRNEIESEINRLLEVCGDLSQAYPIFLSS